MNVITKALLEAKLEHHNLNLFYPIGYGNEAETNMRIEQKISEFLNRYGKYAETHTFVLEYHDDIISAMCYRMLKVISAMSTPINLVIYGKRRKTKDIVKGVKRIGNYRLKKLMKQEKAIYISPFNPLYKVTDSKDIFRDFPNVTWYPMKEFTPYQLKAIRLFYHLGYIKNDIIENDTIINNLQHWCECSYAMENHAWENMSFHFNDNIIEPYEGEIIVLFLTSSIEKNTILLREVEKTDSIVLYKFPDNIDDETHNKIITQLRQYSIFIKSHSNAYGYLNEVDKGITIEDYQEFFGSHITILNENSIKEEGNV